MTDKSVKRYPLSKQVSDKLEQMIADGEYSIGQKIPTELELMDMFSVSRNTLREAIRSLTSAGVLEVRQGDGTYVRSSNRFIANMNLKYSQESMDDITEARNCLEVTIVQLACLRRTDEDLKHIHEALIERQEIKSNVKENTLADIAFHKAIARACHNKIILDLYLSIFSYMESHIEERHIETNMNHAEIDMLHEELYMAVKDRDPDKAAMYTQNILRI